MLILSLLIFDACQNKIDSALDKAESALTRYEKKEADHTATADDFNELQADMAAIQMQPGSVDAKDMTPEQVSRAQQLGMRYASIAMKHAFEVPGGR